MWIITWKVQDKTNMKNIYHKIGNNVWNLNRDLKKQEKWFLVGRDKKFTFLLYKTQT